MQSVVRASSSLVRCGLRQNVAKWQQFAEFHNYGAVFVSPTRGKRDEHWAEVVRCASLLFSYYGRTLVDNGRSFCLTGGQGARKSCTRRQICTTSSEASSSFLRYWFSCSAASPTLHSCAPLPSFAVLRERNPTQVPGGASKSPPSFHAVDCPRYREN